MSDSNRDDLPTQEELTLLAIGVLTKQAIEFFERYSETLDKNAALGIVIEAMSSSLGNIISLVGDEHQQSVIDSANLVIQQGLIDQTETIAEMVYGFIGHA